MPSDFRCPCIKSYGALFLCRAERHYISINIVVSSIFFQQGGPTMFHIPRRGLPLVIALVMFLGMGARSAQAQTFTPNQVQQFRNIRLMQANALFGLIQQLSTSPTAQVPGSAVQSTIALYQTALANVQYQINQLQLLAAALNQANAVFSLAQNAQNQAVQANLLTALANIQYQISILQATIVVP
jgi:hypothetical protein